ncbi:hypothetical protein LX36DRAFT_343979 [Colletotrichum falcatum]|nr:hypothetical protein LX36DRAFT_343979 [Colletotrichum falcatum]
MSRRTDGETARQRGQVVVFGWMLPFSFQFFIGRSASTPYTVSFWCLVFIYFYFFIVVRCSDIPRLKHEPRSSSPVSVSVSVSNVNGAPCRYVCSTRNTQEESKQGYMVSKVPT